MTDLHKPHPAAEIFPLMSGSDFDALVADVRENGLRDPIILHDGLILDGRNRYRACQEAGVDPVFLEWDGEGSVEAFVVSKNLRRRHLSLNERVMIAGRLANMKKGDIGSQRNGAGIPAPTISNAEAAEMLKVSRDSVVEAKTVIREGTPDEIAAVEQGKAAVSTTAKKIRERRAALNVKAEPVATAKPDIRYGGRTVLPEGQTMESLCREGLRMQEAGATVVQIAQELNIAQGTFATMRDVVMLADRTDLSERETKLAQDALAEMNASRQTKAAHDMVEPIAARIWGKIRRVKPDHAEALRLAAFERAFGLITHACSCAAQVEVPHFSKERAAEIAAQLQTAAQTVRDFRVRILEIHQ